LQRYHPLKAKMLEPKCLATVHLTITSVPCLSVSLRNHITSEASGDVIFEPLSLFNLSNWSLQLHLEMQCVPSPISNLFDIGGHRINVFDFITISRRNIIDRMKNIAYHLREERIVLSNETLMPESWRYKHRVWPDDCVLASNCFSVPVVSCDIHSRLSGTGKVLSPVQLLPVNHHSTIAQCSFITTPWGVQ
jgi:hypothetical protein